MYVIQAERPVTVAYTRPTVGITFRATFLRTIIVGAMVVARAVFSGSAAIVAEIFAYVTVIVRT